MKSNREKRGGSQAIGGHVTGSCYEQVPPKLASAVDHQTSREERGGGEGGSVSGTTIINKKGGVG